MEAHPSAHPSQTAPEVRDMSQAQGLLMAKVDVNRALDTIGRRNKTEMGSRGYVLKYVCCTRLLYLCIVDNLLSHKEEASVDWHMYMTLPPRPMSSTHTHTVQIHPAISQTSVLSGL